MGLIACQRGASRLSPPLADAGWLAGLSGYTRKPALTPTRLSGRVRNDPTFSIKLIFAGCTTDETTCLRISGTINRLMD